MKRSITAISTKEVDEFNEKNTTERGFEELITWALKAANSLSIPFDSFYHSFLDIGSGQGYVLRYASSPRKDFFGVEPFASVVGIEVNEDLKPLTKLPKTVSVVKGDATDRDILVPLVSKASIIFWNGLKFSSSNQADVVNIISDSSRVGTFILCNFVISRPNIMHLKQGKLFNALDQVVSWSHNCEWNLYLVLPWKIKANSKTHLPFPGYWKHFVFMKI